MAQSTLSIRVDDELKKDIEEVCSKIGLTLSAATNAFYKQMVRTQGIPFHLSAVELPKRRRLTTEERLRDYQGDYKTEEWDTGEPVGREVF